MKQSTRIVKTRMKGDVKMSDAPYEKECMYCKNKI